ncbi:helix-turn-helix transcriptional regulator [Arthrobacter sp. zg-Y179]|uniref:helix-turn-helix transcriptional regulator n=1 Tax=Arthrobacter sp. zg-Y179 TaxID=2894188 RepID=UPI001E5BAED6|nr:helix-turn-helix transcriptional regulator [Arthrobacter sp. zg-Y179]MCC9173792.1 helix-turn-helix domain-containing protein [Arthrobacter sp. zg-Y179]
MSTHQEEAKKRLGSLITEAYKAAGETRLSLSDAVGLSARSLYAIETGQAIPRKGSQERIEKFFDWRPGAIGELLKGVRGVNLEQITQKTMRTETAPKKVDEMRADLDETARRIQEDAKALSDRLRERDRTIESLEAELKQERNRTNKLQEDLHTAVEALRAQQNGEAVGGEVRSGIVH